jgi:hypothetical protein
MGGALWRYGTQEEGCTDHSFIHSSLHRSRLHPLAASARPTLLCCFLLLLFCYQVLELAQSLGYGVENPDGVAFSQFAASQLDWETIQVRGRGVLKPPQKKIL